MAEAALMDAAACAAVSSPAERRLHREWELLGDLVRLNPARLNSPRAVDSTFYVTLRHTPALAVGSEMLIDEHRLRLEYPRFFPTLPMELYLERPMLHPNIHPLTGFVCLWQSHRVEHSVEHALHRTVAILGWQLMNLDPRHVMQPESLAFPQNLPLALQSEALIGIDHSASFLAAPAVPYRRRLS